jgi:dihydrofolate reductase
MRKLILMMSVSLDGYFEDRNGSLDWLVVDDELHRHFNEQLRAMDAFLDGRLTYELMAGFWPTADLDPSSTRPMVEFASIWRDMPKIVYSTTLDNAEWNSTVMRTVDPEGIRQLKSQPGGDLALGGANLARTFLSHDLMDELWIYVHPVVLGAGRPLFTSADRTALRLVDTRAFGSGVVLLRYEVRPEPVV